MLHSYIIKVICSNKKIKSNNHWLRFDPEVQVLEIWSPLQQCWEMTGLQRLLCDNGLWAVAGVVCCSSELSLARDATAMLICRKEASIKCRHHALGLCSLQNHELNKSRFFINYPVWYSVVATENRLRHHLEQKHIRLLPIIFFLCGWYEKYPLLFHDMVLNQNHNIQGKNDPVVS